MKNNVEAIKICSRCEVGKQDSEFESSTDSWCLDCRNEYKLSIAKDSENQAKTIKKKIKQHRRTAEEIRNVEMLALQEEQKVREKIKAVQELLVKNKLFQPKKQRVLKQIGEQWFWVTE